MHEVIVIGAGPVGSFFAMQKDCLVLEKDKEIGIPVKCTGLVSRNIDRILPLKEHVVNRMIHGAVIHSPTREVTIERKNVAYVIDRKEFDTYLYEEASVKSDFSLGEKVVEYRREGSTFMVKTSKRLLKARYLVDASGPSNKLPYISGLQARVKLKRAHLVEIFFGEKVCPNFFAWVVPESDEVCRIGLATQTPRPYFNNFLKKLGSPRIIDYQAGLIPLTYNNRVVEGGAYLLGDRAGQVKATTGGGLLTGLSSARILARSFEKYEGEWRASIGKELRMHFRIRQFLNRLSDKELDDLILLAESFKPKLEQYGDMDFPTDFILKLLDKNSIGFLIKNFGKFL